MPGEMKLVTVSGDHTARLWDVTRPEIKQIKCFHAHTRSVKTAVFRDDDRGTEAYSSMSYKYLYFLKKKCCFEKKPNFLSIFHIKDKNISTLFFISFMI